MIRATSKRKEVSATRFSYCDFNASIVPRPKPAKANKPACLLALVSSPPRITPSSSLAQAIKPNNNNRIRVFLFWNSAQRKRRGHKRHNICEGYQQPPRFPYHARRRVNESSLLTMHPLNVAPKRTLPFGNYFKACMVKRTS